MLKTRSFTFPFKEALFIVILLIISVVEQTSGNLQNNFILNVEFLRYNNPTSRIGTSNRHCCSVFGCEFDCENYFTFCLRSPDTSDIIRGNFSECPHGRFETGVVSGGDNIEFPQQVTEDGVTIRSPFEFTFNSLNKSVQLLVLVKSNNFKMEGVLIEKFTVNLELQRGLFTAATTVEGDLGVGSISLGLRVFCANNHFGDGCGVMCEGANDVGGHYTCDSEGNVVCLPGFVDPSNKCITSASELNGPSSNDTESTRSETNVVVVGIAATLLIVALLIVIVVISVLLLVARKRKLINGNKVCCRMSYEEDGSLTLKATATVLGDNPTYGGGTTSYNIINDSSNKSSSAQPHYENTNLNSTDSSSQRDDHERALTLTRSYSYDYITNRPINGYRLRQVQEQVNTQHDQLQESTGSSVTYYSIEYAQNKLAGVQWCSAAERKEPQNSYPTQGGKSKSNMGLPPHYETMETYNDNSDTVPDEGQPSELVRVKLREVDPRSHYEFDSES